MPRETFGLPFFRLTAEPALESKASVEESDAAVAQARAGDQEAFRALVERYSRAVFRLAYRMTGNEQDAEDVVQETFLRVYRGLDRFEARANFATWLHRIAVNYSLDMLRARRQQPSGSSPGQRRPNDPSDAEYSEAARALVANDPAPDRLAYSGEVGRRVESALSRLSKLERAAFVLRHFEGVSIEEIGRALGLSAGATKNSVFRAVQKLRRELEPLVSSSK